MRDQAISKPIKPPILTRESTMGNSNAEKQGPTASAPFWKLVSFAGDHALHRIACVRCGDDFLEQEIQKPKTAYAVLLFILRAASVLPSVRLFFLQPFRLPSQPCPSHILSYLG